MRSSGLRPRVALLVIVAVAVGWLGQLLFRTLDRALPCTRLSTQLCSTNGTGYSTASRVVIGLLAFGVIFGLAFVAARWALAPVRALAAMMGRLGPMNLAERTEVPPSGDDLAELAGAVDGMLDRLAAGYEGQRAFAANASHELRTPLAVQRTLIEVSLTGATTPAELDLLARQLLLTNERNERLIEGLLVLAESDRGLAGRTPCRLDEIVRRVLDAHADLAKRHDVVLVPRLAVRTVPGEAVLLERLVTNLVRNAIAYNVAGGTVDVAVGDEPALVVVNTGDAVPPEEVDALFEPFRRGLQARVGQQSGSGLGLTIVRSVARAHGGRVVAAALLQGGLQVDVTLPTIKE